MVETCAGPSELHLKKELTALRKARFLRDPETCSSWRSPVSSRSVIATSSVNSGNGTIQKLVGKNNNVVSIERGEGKSKKVYLYNWRHRSTKSVDNGVKRIEEDNLQTVTGTSEENFSNHHAVDSMSDTFPEFSGSIYKAAETLYNRTDRNSRSTITRNGVNSHSAISTLLDIGSSSLGILNSGEQSDDTENYNSEDLQHFKCQLSQKTHYLSHSTSPLFSDSGFGNFSRSSKIFRMTRRHESSQSCTPASTNSYYNYGAQNPVDSCDGTTASFDGDDLDQPDLANGQGCGISCYWSKRSKYRGIGGLNSPSLSDTLKRKGSSILCGSNSLNNRKRSSGPPKQKCTSKCSQDLPLLTTSCDGGSSSLDTASDELSTNLAELDLEAVSRLDGKRWSSCRSQDAAELARPGESDLEIEDKRSLSHRYQPRFFDEVIGQNIVVQSLRNAVLKGRIAPAYLFQGPRGTGKTTIARIFSAALNCLSNEDKKPCWLCRECIVFSSRNKTIMNEVNATNKKGLDKFRYSLKNMLLSKSISQYNIFVIDDCHMLSAKVWSSFMKFLEEPLPRVVFIFITINPDNLPQSILSRCQKYLFSKVKDGDIIDRLRQISEQEHLDVELDALDLIALNSDGSPRDAETMLDQLSLLGKKITTALVNDLVGVVSDDKLLDLLEIAMSSDNAETVKRSRELMDSGVDPIALMSQLAGFIMDIIAGTYELTNLQIHDTALGKRSLTEAELDRLKQALKILSDAEKQLRNSTERSTWFTAALLQLGDGHNLGKTQSCNNIKQSSRESDGVVVSDMAYNSRICNSRRSLDNTLTDTGLSNDATDVKCTYVSPDKLDEIWRRSIDQCHSRTLRQLLHGHGRLVSIVDNEGTLVVSISFEDDKIKTRAERFLSSITNSFEIVLSQNVEVRMGILPKISSESLEAVSKFPVSRMIENDNKAELDAISVLSNQDRCKGGLPLKGIEYSKARQQTAENSETSLIRDDCLLVQGEGKDFSCVNDDKGQLASTQQLRKEATDEQRLESAWLQAAEKSTPEFVNHSKPEKNQVLPQNGLIGQNFDQPTAARPTKFRESELNHEIQALKVCDAEGLHKEQIGCADQCAVSPSLLHNYTSVNKDNQGYESGPGCNGLLCWKTLKTNRQKVKQGIHIRPKRTGSLSLFAQCAKLQPGDNKSRKQ